MHLESESNVSSFLLRVWSIERRTMPHVYQILGAGRMAYTQSAIHMSPVILYHAFSVLFAVHIHVAQIGTESVLIHIPRLAPHVSIVRNIDAVKTWSFYQKKQ